MDKTQQNDLLKLRQRFITEEAFGGNLLHEGINAILTDQSSVEWKTRTAHAGALMSAWEVIVKDGMPGEWPEPPLSSDGPGTALDQLTGETARAAIRLKRKSEHAGVLPPGEVGPIRHAKSIFAQRIEQLENDNKGKTGRKRDFLADECVIAGTDRVRRQNGKVEDDKATWCIRVSKPIRASENAGHDPTRIKNHAYQCQKLQAEWPELWELVDKERGGSSLSTALSDGNTSALPAVRKPVEPAAETSAKSDNAPKGSFGCTI
ncbi:hypothetical protein B0H19DRAFT_1250987 [Mycena capillaripes]|nr:hypothetical protein B0H19DRAFT_1250987 [Mycena capillaripes]